MTCVFLTLQGMNAFVNGELGTVKFVGRVDFADGIWIGVHLKNPSMLYIHHSLYCRANENLVALTKQNNI